MKVPLSIPERGFYYHYKRKVDSELNDDAYEMVGVGAHTEDDCRPEDANMMVYRPLYELDEFEGKRFFFLRSLEMWMGNVTKDGKTFPRFSKITDPDVLAKLKVIRNEMYGD